MDNTAIQIDEPATALIEEHVRYLLVTMGMQDKKVDCRTNHDEEGNTLRINIDAGEDGRALIGMHGTHLSALQHIIRCLIRRQLTGEVRVMVDVNGYRARREQALLGLAQETARKAHRTGHAITLEPMTAADRHAVHTALAENKNIQTESVGEEPSRRVVVRPTFL